jgi:hypothetical protein
MLSVLSGVELDASRWVALSGGTVCIAAGTAALAGLYRLLSGVGRGVLLPAVFFNAGNMGLACARLAYGQEGLEAGALIYVMIALLTSLFGIWIAKGENGLAEALRIPLLYGAVAGIGLSISGLALPWVLMEPIHMLGAMAIPLMLLTLGVQLRTLRLQSVRHAAVAVAVRILGGFACALLFVSWLGVEGLGDAPRGDERGDRAALRHRPGSGRIRDHAGHARQCARDSCGSTVQRLATVAHGVKPAGTAGRPKLGRICRRDCERRAPRRVAQWMPPGSRSSKRATSASKRVPLSVTIS